MVVSTEKLRLFLFESADNLLTSISNLKMRSFLLLIKFIDETCQKYDNWTKNYTVNLKNLIMLY